MTVSVIIPTYNRGHLIARAISSVVAQEYSKWELIVVDDGSSDCTEEMVSRFLADCRIKYFKKENSGAADSRNFGVTKSVGELITFLDSDDEVRPNWLKRMVFRLNLQQADIVCCGFERVDEQRRETGSGMPRPMGRMFHNTVARFTNAGVYLLRKGVFNAVGGFDPKLRSGQHTELAMRIIPLVIRDGLKVVNIFEPLVIIHIHAGVRIRYSAEAVYLGSKYTLTKHRRLFQTDPDNHYAYLTIAAVMAMRTGRYSEGNRLFRRALLIRPLNPLSWMRVVLSALPVLRGQPWSGRAKSVKADTMPK